MAKTAKFNLGDRVRHVQHGYLAVVVDIDPLFQASGRFNPQALKREFATRNPWYRLAVDQSTHLTYVEECKLVADNTEIMIDNPYIHNYLIEQKNTYKSTLKKH